jgi:hypothetical protein
MVEGFHITCMRLGKYDKNHFDEYIHDILKKMPDSVCFKATGYMNNLPLVQKWENKNPVFDENGKKVMVKNHGLKLQLMICPDNDSQKEAAIIFDDIYAKYSKTETNGMEFKNFKSKEFHISFYENEDIVNYHIENKTIFRPSTFFIKREKLSGEIQHNFETRNRREQYLDNNLMFKFIKDY